jgi:hypothetical protein
MTTTRIIGVDCATKAQRAGLAVATLHDGRLVLQTVEVGRGSSSMAAFAVPRIVPYLAQPEPVLLALDAPLGWPQPLATALKDHAAGEPLDPGIHGTNRLFRRATDVFVEATLKKARARSRSEPHCPHGEGCARPTRRAAQARSRAAARVGARGRSTALTTQASTWDKARMPWGRRRPCSQGLPS